MASTVRWHYLSVSHSSSHGVSPFFLPLTTRLNLSSPARVCQKEHQEVAAIKPYQYNRPIPKLANYEEAIHQTQQGPLLLQSDDRHSTWTGYFYQRTKNDMPWLASRLEGLVVWLRKLFKCHPGPRPQFPRPVFGMLRQEGVARFSDNKVTNSSMHTRIR